MKKKPTTQPQPNFEEFGYVELDCPEPFNTHTSGLGLWSAYIKPVTITKIGLRLEDYDLNISDVCENGILYLDAYFPKSEWKPVKHGLIYTDPLWITEFNHELKKTFPRIFGRMKFDYTEQGMQGRDYVSLESSTIISGARSVNFLRKRIRDFIFCQALDKINKKHNKALRRLAK